MLMGIVSATTFISMQYDIDIAVILPPTNKMIVSFMVKGCLGQIIRSFEAIQKFHPVQIFNINIPIPTQVNKRVIILV